MITIAQYFGDKTPSPGHGDNAEDLLVRVNSMLERAAIEGAYAYKEDPDTGTQISGSKGGSGDGGYRLPSSDTGQRLSSHKEAMGVDVYDPDETLDNWITDAMLARFGLYREHPSKTRGWAHLSTRPPRSLRRTFYP